MERPNDKSVKFTAVDIQDEASMGGVKVFLVMVRLFYYFDIKLVNGNDNKFFTQGSYTDMESLFNAMQHRLRRFNQQ